MGRGASGDVARLSLTLPGRAAASEIAIGRGAVERIPRLLEEVGEPGVRYAVVTDETVSRLHGARVAERLRASGRKTDLLTFPAGEGNKSAAQWAVLLEQLASLGFGRDGCIVAVGGGVTGDLAGFIAATFARGVSFVQVPTSLVAMIDASIGGKTGVDLAAGKNLAGAFHQPRLVVTDPALLETLPPEQLRAGFAEAVKHGAVASAEYLEGIREEAAALVDRHPPAMDRLIDGSIRIKAGIVARDALESGERAILNFGHTIGHGIEQASGYAIGHGEAVAIGMVVEAVIGERIGLTASGTADRLREVLEVLGLPVRRPDVAPVEEVLRATASDKKNRSGATRYALISQIGRAGRTAGGAWTTPVDGAVAAAALESS